MKLSDIKPNPSNPRIIKDDKFKKLVNSISEFPKAMNLRPIIVDGTGMILGGNQRFKALQQLGYKDIPDAWVKRADELTEDEKRRFIILDNISFGDMDWEAINNDWSDLPLSDWGLDLPGFDVNKDEYGEGFSLKDGEKEPFQQMTFTLADEQATIIQNAIADIKHTEEYKFAETMGNENSNGNALYLIVMQWAEQRK